MLAISVDDEKTVREFADSLKASYPMLSDQNREVSKAYGVLDPGGHVDRRTTFVIDRQGVIRKIDEGTAALDPNGVVSFCNLLKR